jgi:hypothetical protein
MDKSTITKTCLRNIKIVALANCMFSRSCFSTACTKYLVSAVIRRSCSYVLEYISVHTEDGDYNVRRNVGT